MPFPAAKAAKAPAKNAREAYTIENAGEEAAPHTLPARVEEARRSPEALNALVADYMPFIRREASRYDLPGLEQDEKESLAMITFAACVAQYSEGRGNFISYTSAAIRNRLLDEAKKQSRHNARTVPLEYEDAEDNVISYQQAAAAQAHERALQRGALAEEIERYAAKLAEFGIELENLDLISPKHSRLRRQCVNAARALAASDSLRARFLATGRLPAGELCRLCGIPPKTLEKCRRYIVAAALILLGDFSLIEGFLPAAEE